MINNYGKLGGGIAIAAIWAATAYIAHAAPTEIGTVIGYAVGATALVAIFL